MDKVIPKEVLKEYSRLRLMGWQAKWAYVGAKTKAAWDAMGGFFFDYDCYERTLTQGPGETVFCSGPMRLVLRPEEECYDDSYIDTWDDCSEKEREKYKLELWDRIERDGVWGLIGEYWDGSEWVQADSCWGFVGNDWKDSGHDTDIMAMTISAYSDHLEVQAKKLESERPDMYKSDSLKTHEPHDLKEWVVLNLSVCNSP